MKQTILFLFLIIVLSSCDIGRTSSKERMETVSKVKLPKDFIVLRDEYDDMIQDYGIVYDIQLNQKSADEYADSIKHSIFFNPDVINKGTMYDSFYVMIDSTKSVWCKSTNGYMFAHENGNTKFRIWFDTLSNKVSYEETEY